jgi:hypothetical protein
MTAGVEMPPERPARRTHPDSRCMGRTASVVAAAPVGITTYDADGDRRRRRCPCGVATADVMMTMVGEMGGKATARRRRGNGEATVRRRQGNGGATARRRRGDGEATARRRRGDGEATARRWRGDYTRQQGCEGNRLWRRRWQGQQGNRQADNK